MYQQQTEDEVESQRVQALAAYRLLQLRPGAPQEVISEVYWLLAARAGRVDRSLRSQQNEARVQELNHAYEVLAVRDRFAKSGTSLSAARKERRGSRSSSGSASRPSHYELLCIDNDADPDVIALCAGILIQAAPASSALREQIAEAGRVLCDPELGAAYNESLGPRHSPPVDDSPKATATPETRKLADPPGILTAIALDIGDVARFVWRRGRRNGSDHKVIADGEESGGASVERQRVPPAFAWNTATPAGYDNGVARAVAPPVKPIADNMKRHQPSGWFRSIVRRLEARPPATDASVSAQTPAPKRAAPAREKERLIEAGHARLMTLRDDAGFRTLSASAPSASTVMDIALAELAFIEGPRAGERIRLGSDGLNVGTGETADLRLQGDDDHIAQEHARIWRHRDHFVFRQIDGESTLIGGEPLTLPMVMLEDGDEITIGIHRLRFTQVPSITSRAKDDHAGALSPE